MMNLLYLLTIIIAFAIFDLSMADAGTTSTKTSFGAFANSGRGANCRFLLTRKSATRSKSLSAGVNRKLRPNAKQRNRRSKGSSTSMLMVSPGLRGSIEVDGSFAQVSCIRTARTMIVEVFASKGRGRKTSSISTSITVSPGQTINIGSVVRKLRNKGTEISTRRGVQYEKSNSSSQDQIFLKVQ